jgi:hypothetical protein
MGHGLVGHEAIGKKVSRSDGAADATAQSGSSSTQR